MASDGAPIPSSDTSAEARGRAGLLAGIGSYFTWGFLPLLFHFLEPSGPLTVVAHRTIWSLVFVGLILLVMKRLPEIAAALRDPATLRSMVISAVLLAGNWLLYVWAVGQGHVLESSFGYFINPMVNVAIGMVLLGERHNNLQKLSIAISLIAIVIQGFGIGRIPYIALGLALSFGFYGFFRKTAKVSSATGLFVETLVLAPIALVYLGYSLMHDGAAIYSDPLQLGLLLLCGPATAVPLLLFAFAVQRLRLTTIGMLQYIGPSIQFLLAIFWLHEPLNPLKIVSFALIWLSIAVYSADSLMRRGKTNGHAGAAAGAEH